MVYIARDLERLGLGPFECPTSVSSGIHALLMGSQLCERVSHVSVLSREKVDLLIYECSLLCDLFQLLLASVLCCFLAVHHCWNPSLFTLAGSPLA